MKTPLSPSQFLESGQIFAFGGMCQELMDAPTPTSISLPVQQTPSPGELSPLIPVHLFLKLASSLFFLCHNPPCCCVSGQSGAYSLCEVCNLQLTSDAQAQLHYNGRSHLRRVRQLQAGETGQHVAGTTQPLLSCDCITV